MLCLRSTAFLTAAMMLAGSASCMVPINLSEEAALVGTVWELQQIQFSDGKQLVANPPQHYTLEFSDAGEVFVRADCNRALGAFSLEDSRLSITMGPSTLVACPEGSIGSEFITALDNSSLFFFQNDDLIIEMAFDSGAMTFSPTATAALMNRVWKLQTIQFNDGTLLTAKPPDHYTVEFSAQGKVTVRADCNQGQGSFTTTDNRLTIEGIATTRAACPEGSIDTEFISALTNSALYFFQDGDLFIDLKANSGTMRFSAD